MDIYTKLTILETTARMVDLSKYEDGAFIRIRYDEKDRMNDEKFQADLVIVDEDDFSGERIIDGFSKYGLTFEEALDQIIGFGTRDNKVVLEEGVVIY